MNKLYSFITVLLVLALVTACGPSLAKRKEEAKVHYDLGVVLLNERNLSEALKELTQAIETYPDEPSYHNALGLAYFARGMNPEAVRSLKKAVSIDPDFSEAHLNLSAVYITEQKWDLVISESKAALSNIFYRTPEMAYLNMGWAYYSTARYDEALESYKKAAELRPGYSQAYYNTGLVYDRTGRYKDAVSAYAMAVKTSPAYLDAYFALGMAQVKVKDKAAAEKSFKKVIELAPDSERARSAREYIRLIK